MPWVICSTDSQVRAAGAPAWVVSSPGTLGPSAAGELHGLVSAVCPGSQFSSPGDPRQSSEWPSAPEPSEVCSRPEQRPRLCCLRPAARQGVGTRLQGRKGMKERTASQGSTAPDTWIITFKTSQKDCD